MKLSVSLTLIRPRNGAQEVFLARRRDDREFLGGFHAFFAGSVEEEDQSFAHAALRESFEEAGLLFDQGRLTLLAPDHRDPSRFGAADHDPTLSRLHHFGWWKTPSWLAPAHTTLFFGLTLTEEEGHLLDGLAAGLATDEFTSGHWTTPGEALSRWQKAEVFLTTPIERVLSFLEQNTASGTYAPFLGATRQEAATAEAVELCGGVVMLPLKTATLPPATHTNAVMVGHREFVLVDPGPADPVHLQPLLGCIARRRERGDRLKAIVLTHHHPDHIGGLTVLAEHVEAPLLAHTETLRRLGPLPFTLRAIGDGEVIATDLDSALVVHHTPGHAPGHLALHLPGIDLLLGGDLVASKGTIVVDPPEGNMGQYLKSLRRMRALGLRALLPAHGHLITAPDALIKHYIAHREFRETLVFEALRKHGPASSDTLVPHVYPDVPISVWPLAERSLLAHLLHLVEQGVAVKEGRIFSARDSMA